MMRNTIPTNVTKASTALCTPQSCIFVQAFIAIQLIVLRGWSIGTSESYEKYKMSNFKFQNPILKNPYLNPREE